MTTAEKKHRQAWLAFWLALSLLLLAAVWFIYAGPALRKHRIEAEIREIETYCHGKVKLDVYSTPHWLGLENKIPDLPMAWGIKISGILTEWQKTGGIPALGHLSINAPLSPPERQELFQHLGRFTIFGIGGDGITDADLENICHHSELTLLALGSSSVTDAGLKMIGRLSELSILDLSNTTVTDTGLKEFAHLSKLHILVICNTKISDSGLKELTRLPLSHLRLSGTQITDAGLLGLTKLPLKRLFVSSSISPEAIKRMKEEVKGNGYSLEVIIVEDEKKP
jgi:hypothetical protein